MLDLNSVFTPGRLGFSTPDPDRCTGLPLAAEAHCVVHIAALAFGAGAASSLALPLRCASHFRWRGPSAALAIVAGAASLLALPLRCASYLCWRSLLAGAAPSLRWPFSLARPFRCASNFGWRGLFAGAAPSLR
ncbi:hypothetical protein B0H16DRAFT_1749322 [Mycena metata]|uniref:Uncharacterized protein n=1 Tax=Mycena metata TaxID=1033252 RepID=A0AAD7DW48_9AGAR|nr:hypothetical protein B0H16DRAFT_1749322 [Mycena metata]